MFALCTSALLHIFHTFALLHKFHTFALLHIFHTFALLHLCTCALVHLCTCALLHFCTCALLHFCTFARISLFSAFTQLHNTYTTICKGGHILLCWLMIIRVKKKMLGVQARKEYAHTFAHFNHIRCANVQKYVSVDDQSSKKKLLNWCWSGARKRFLSVSKLIKWMWWVVKFESKKCHVRTYICEFSECDEIFYIFFYFQLHFFKLILVE